MLYVFIIHIRSFVSSFPPIFEYKLLYMVGMHITLQKFVMTGSGGSAAAVS